jgi:transcriptional regulator GlxA family with amidase domain
LTADAVPAGIDPALHLLDRECGPDAADGVAADL